MYAPHYLKNKDGHYSCPYEDKICYVSEYADFPLAEENECPNDFLKKEALHHLGVLASNYSNYDLIPERSMWSIIDLAPLDVDIDEKQENLNTLLHALTEIGEIFLADQIRAFNMRNREKIQQIFDKLPRCVYQGDLNDSNILLKDGHFYGLIDFNMSGTEVNINCFLCETDRGLLEDDFDKYSAKELLHEMISSQNNRLRIIFANYTLNDVETQVFENYRNIILISQYPNVCDYIYFLNTVHKAKVLELLRLIIERPIACNENPKITHRNVLMHDS